MSEKNEITLLHVQRKLKPKIEDVIPEYLDGDMEKNAIDFITYMQENKMVLRWAGVHNAWKANYKSKPICYVRLADGNNPAWLSSAKNAKLTITPYLNNINKYQERIINEDWQDSIWDNLYYCKVCGNGCAPGKDKIILGKEFKGLCNGIFYCRFSVSFVNPDDITISRIKKMLEWEKQARTESKQS